MKVIFNTSPVFEANRKAIERIIINQGGTDSGKTYAIMQLLFGYAMTWDAPKDDAVITVLGESIPNLKKGAYRIAESIAMSIPGLQAYIKAWNKTDRTVTFITGWIMEFVSCETEQSAKQGKRQYLFVNEANGIKNYRIFFQMAKRTRRKVFIDYNPSEPFWSHEKLIGTGPGSNDLHRTVRLIISDHRHNPFLTREQHAETEGIIDRDLWLVYARGKTGNLSGLIFPNWTVIPDKDFPEDADFCYGLDYGYSVDPTACVRVAKIGNSLFIKELIYTVDPHPIKVKALLTADGITEDDTIYCEHDPDSTAALQHQGLRAIPARKGKGSIKAGIKRIKEFRVYVTESSKNILDERSKYKYKVDKDTGKATNDPVDTNNHLMDAIRYAVFSKWTYDQYE